MDRNKLVQEIGKEKLIVILRGTGQEESLKVVDSLIESGAKFIEVTMNTPNALSILESMASKFGGKATFGAGTILNSASAINALNSGACFVVTPTVKEEVIRSCNSMGRPCIIGAFSATEILTAYELGADLVKVFPASIVGPGYIKALRGPLNHIPLVPTGGINLENARAFIDAGAYALGVGSELVDKKAIQEGNFEKIRRDAAKLIELLKGS